MSKQNRPLLAVFLGMFLVAGAFLVGRPTSAVPVQGTGVAVAASRNAAIVAATVAILKETSEIRELSILRPVQSGALSRAEIERMIIRNLNEQTRPSEMHATELALKKLGLVPPGFRFRPFVIKLLTEQVAGYYDAKAQRFYLADWLALESQKPVMAHELTHALQDQHFNLRRFEKWPAGDSDAELAAHALIEGDATLVMTVYMARNPLVALAFMRTMSSGGASLEQFKQAPRALRESLLFPYEEGAEWVTQLYKRDGWRAVSQAYKDLPQSTEQILHVDKYYAHEVPVKVSLPDVRNLLGRKWKRLDYDVNGEWSYYLILDQYLNSPADSKRAAAGWSGDRYEIYEGPKPGDLFLAQRAVWDTEDDAREFLDAYVKRTGRRYADGKATSIPSAGEKRDSHAWQTDEGAVVIERRGKSVLILEGVPDGVDSRRLLKTLR